MEAELRLQRLIPRGDERAAAAEAIRRLGPAVLRYLRAMLRDESDAADAFSVFAEALWKGLPAFRGECMLRTWAFRLRVPAVKKVRAEAWRRRVRPFASGEASAIADEIRMTSLASVERRQER